VAENFYYHCAASSAKMEYEVCAMQVGGLALVVSSFLGIPYPTFGVAPVFMPVLQNQRLDASQLPARACGPALFAAAAGERIYHQTLACATREHRFGFRTAESLRRAWNGAHCRCRRFNRPRPKVHERVVAAFEPLAMRLCDAITARR
jgi:hypothetical protein